MLPVIPLNIDHGIFYSFVQMSYFVNRFQPTFGELIEAIGLYQIDLYELTHTNISSCLRFLLNLKIFCRIGCTHRDPRPTDEERKEKILRLERMLVGGYPDEDGTCDPSDGGSPSKPEDDEEIAAGGERTQPVRCMPSRPVTCQALRSIFCRQLSGSSDLRFFPLLPRDRHALNVCHPLL